MNPAGSVIVFTVSSGLGFGLLTWLGLGLPDVRGWAAFWYYALGFGLAGGGLLASTFHLGNPQRFLKAFSQWRSSWLSREGCLAVAALTVLGLFAIGALMSTVWQPLGYIGAVLAVLTVFATSMIYAQLKTVPRWNHWSTPVLFMLLSLGGGGLLAMQVWPAMILLALVGVMQLVAWLSGDGRFESRGTDIGTATGLGVRGIVRAFEPPHTGNNYLLKEMVHKVGRKHAVKLRIIAFVLMIVAPLGLLMVSCEVPMVILAAILHATGTFAQRWLFFAEAEHVVGLYYGKR
ncbi:MAG: dimethyl sulfoxide reductase anchor subunit family protein [Rhodobacterales bacterium]|jgi:DMSO reductase anchor subunit|uniref:dimethyl sulfoxide reductase anchor subunit family protein n=1 Tax=uncultured Planktomarina sp. TaxID=1538529 RepID=UPI003260EAA9|tara:strand:- start:8269 stop:9138 length:870 start_codon:yes stop_codon:yes gene_type:complete